MKNNKTKEELSAENKLLKSKLASAEETLDAILSGKVDALVVSDKIDSTIFSLEGTDYTYRIFIEKMKEGAITIDDEGKILFCNSQFAKILSIPIEQIIEYKLKDFIVEKDQEILEALLSQVTTESVNGELCLYSKNRGKIEVHLSITDLQIKNIHEICIVVTDLTEIKKAEAALRTAHDELEQRVKDRTEELTRLNSSLKKEVTIRKMAEKKIEASLKEKEIMLKEIHHRVKNNLQIVSSLLNLQSAYITDKEAKEYFNESQNRIKSMALIHEKLYGTQNFTNLNFGVYVKELTSNLFSSYNNQTKYVKLELALEDVNLDLDLAIILGLIINELVSNSLKHAFPVPPPANRKWKIKVGLSSFTSTVLKLSISDNGVGIPNEVDINNTNSLGMQLVNAFVDQLKGTLEINTENETEFIIYFPLKSTI